MGFSKALRKVFRSKKKKDLESQDDAYQTNQGGRFPASQNGGFDQIWSFGQNGFGENAGFERGKSVRRGIYEPYRQHFPVKSSQYDSIQPYEPAQPNQKQNGQYGPKLVTADGTYNQNGDFTPSANYSEHRVPNLTRSGSNASLCHFQNQHSQNHQNQAPANYQMFQPRSVHGQFGGSQMNLSSTPAVPNFRRPVRSNSTLSNYEVAAFQSQQQNQATRGATIQRQGSLSSIPTFTSNPFNQFQKQNQHRPSSVIGGQFSQQQPIAQQHSNYAPPVMSPVSSNYPSTRSSSFINNRVMSPVGSVATMSNAGDAPAQFEQQVFTLSQLRSSQANLQQALRAQEDILRQNGPQNTPELDTTMKIMQTCLDMLDSISGLVERSTTPVPQQQPMTVFEPEKPFINHQMKPKKSALKQRKSNSSAFEKVAPKASRSAEIVSDSSDGYFEESSSPSAESGLETPDLSCQTSPGPSELSEDSGFERAASASPAKKLDEFKPMLSSLSQLKISQM
ncbi:Oidioi.mRNA.OKI2018_I69.chr2.g4146.t2.cds [Oikopleura dioica]|uniref:Oidioi.mRNA.OKI2018_I69.chr2.g4146.t2.cds n=1 Tax=Oikopleura dioica TaxID=34765 RepID=A0ABN7SZV9_OIKDI|nr:Oidioi.mRNA.OKI2018_I69.chr2.g4146.t2.cds [Oikopleura dioica]